MCFGPLCGEKIEERSVTGNEEPNKNTINDIKHPRKLVFSLRVSLKQCASLNNPAAPKMLYITLMIHATINVKIDAFILFLNVLDKSYNSSISIQNRMQLITKIVSIVNEHTDTT